MRLFFSVCHRDIPIPIDIETDLRITTDDLSMGRFGDKCYDLQSIYDGTVLEKSSCHCIVLLCKAFFIACEVFDALVIRGLCYTSGDSCTYQGKFYDMIPVAVRDIFNLISFFSNIPSAWSRMTN